MSRSVRVVARLIASLLAGSILAAPGLSLAQRAGNGPPIPVVQPAPQAPILPSVNRTINVLDFGAIGNGSTDDSAAFQRAVLAGAGQTVIASGHRFLLNNNLDIPQQTIIDCQNGETGPVDGSNLNNEPALLLEPSFTIIESGPGVTIKNCTIVNPANTYPITTEPTWTGIAVKDPGWGDLHLIHDTIVGYDTAVYVMGGRPDIEYLYADGTGITHPVVYFDFGNTDSGVYLNSKVQPIAGVNSCTNSVALRPGNGFEDDVGGSIGTNLFMNNDVVQNFAGTDYIFNNDVAIGTIWGDDTGYTCGSFGTSNGMTVASNVFIYGGSVYLNQADHGLVNYGRLWLSQLVSNFAGLDCIDNSGTIHVKDVNTGQCGGEAIGIQSNTSNTMIDHLVINSVNNNTLPFISSSVGPVSFGSLGNIYWRTLSTPVLGNQFDNNFTGVENSDTMLASMGITPVLSGCTGIGTGGSCSNLFSDHTMNTIQLTAGPSGATSTGQFTLTYSPSAQNTQMCFAQIVNSSLTWAVGATTAVAAYPTAITIKWSNNGIALTAGANYPIAVKCSEL